MPLKIVFTIIENVSIFQIFFLIKSQNTVVILPKLSQDSLYLISQKNILWKFSNILFIVYEIKKKIKARIFFSTNHALCVAQPKPMKKHNSCKYNAF